MRDRNRPIDNATAQRGSQTSELDNRMESVRELAHIYFFCVCFISNYSGNLTSRELEIKRVPLKGRRRASDDIGICEALF